MAAIGGDNNGYVFRKIPLDDLIISEFNVRRRDITADIDGLAHSIDIFDLQQPIVVQPKGDKFEIIIGQRRYLAAKQLGWVEIDARVLDEPKEEQEVKIASFSENVQRRDLTPRDKADVCSYLLEIFDSPREVAEYVGTTETTVKKWLGFAAVPEFLKVLVQPQRRISTSQAVRIWANVRDEEKARAIADEIARTKPPRARLNRIMTAMEEMPTRPLNVILQRAEQLARQRSIQFILPERWTRAIELAAQEQQIDPNEIAREATIEWLQLHFVFAEQ